MPHREYADQVEDLRGRLDQLRRQEPGSSPALEALAAAIEPFGACAAELGRAEANDRALHTRIQQREQHFRSLFDYNLDAVFSIDAQGRFTAVNPAGEKLSGYPTAQLLQMGFAQLLTPDTLLTTMQVFQQALGGASRDLEAAFVHKDGRRIEVYVNGGPIVIDGQTVGVFGFARDITERKRAEAEIRRLNEQLEQRVAERTARLEAVNQQLQVRSGFQRLIAELSTNFIRLKTEQIDAGLSSALEQIGRFANVDRSCLCVYSDDHSNLTCTHEWCAPGISPAIQDVQADPTTNNPWITPLLLAGQVVHVPCVADLPAEAAAERKAFSAWSTQSFIMVPLLLAGQVVGVIGFDSVREQKHWPADIIDLLQIVGEMLVNALQRQRAERALRENEQKYRGIVENTQDVIMLTRGDGVITYISPATRQVLGYEPEDLTGRQPWITHPDDLARVRRMHGEALRGRSGTNFEYRILTRDRQTKWVSHSWSIIPGEPLHTIVSVVRDITERKAVHEQIERHQEQLRALASELVLAEERERRHLAGDLHDDIGQLLALAQIRLGVLDRSAAGTNLAVPLGQLRKLIEQTMQATRSLTFQLCPPALYDLGFVPAAEWLVEDMQQRYGLRVELVHDGADMPLDERLRIVLFRSLREVLINTAKHAGVTCARVAIGRDGGLVRVQVADAGAGFDPATVRTRCPGGFGLFSIEERLGYLGGRLAIRSAPGGGTTVTLEAPLDPARHGQEETSP